MFFLQRMRDTIRVVPQLFDADGDSTKVLSFLIDSKYSNKVVPNVGLCVCVFDFEHMGDSHIFPGDGSAHIEVDFRLVIFRPFENEVLEGEIKECNENGVVVSLGFFADIVIPPWLLQQPSFFDETEQLWVWKYSTEEDEDEKFFMDIGESVRFRVVGVRYTTLSKDGNTGTTMATITGAGSTLGSPTLMSPQPPGSARRGRSQSMDWSAVSMEALQKPARQRSMSLEVKEGGSEEFQPMSVIASIREDGLGLVSWWPDDCDEEEDGQGEENPAFEA